MAISEITAKSVLRKHRKIDSWFLSRYSMNLYRGCTHNCTYCDGRAEKYRVDGIFGQDTAVKTNALEILHKEIDPARRRKPLNSGFFMIGGGVGDSYQPAEEKYGLTGNTLKLMNSFGYPVHILTKSPLVLKNADLIGEINGKTRAVVSFSFSSTDESISSRFEPGVACPGKRLEAISRFRELGIPTGAFLMPVIPYITDIPEILTRSIRDIRKAGADFIIISGLTLKEGRQKEHFYSVLKNRYSELIPEYTCLYPDDEWGNPVQGYSDALHCLFAEIAAREKIPVRMPFRFWKDILTENDRAVVLLEHIDHMLKLVQSDSPFGYAAYSVSKLTAPLSEQTESIKKIKGVGPNVEKVLKEIVRTGTSSLYSRLSADFMPG